MCNYSPDFLVPSTAETSARVTERQTVVYTESTALLTALDWTGLDWIRWDQDSNQMEGENGGEVPGWGGGGGDRGWGEMRVGGAGLREWGCSHH